MLESEQLELELIVAYHRPSKGKDFHGMSLVYCPWIYPTTTTMGTGEHPVSLTLSSLLEVIECILQNRTLRLPTVTKYLLSSEKDRP